MKRIRESLRPAWLLSFALLVAIAATARSEVEVLATIRTATLHAESGDFFDPENPNHAVCDHSRSWLDFTQLISRSEFCQAIEGYGFAESRVVFRESTVSDEGFVTDIVVHGSYWYDPFWQNGGTYETHYTQAYDFLVTGSASLTLSGSLSQAASSSAQMVILRNGEPFASFEPPDSESIVYVDEHYELSPGTYHCQLDFLGVPNPHLGEFGGSSADLVATLGPGGLVSVEPSTWGRVKELYR